MDADVKISRYPKDPISVFVLDLNMNGKWMHPYLLLKIFLYLIPRLIRQNVTKPVLSY